jgi:outer membrane protein TolC
MEAFVNQRFRAFELVLVLLLGCRCQRCLAQTVAADLATQVIVITLDDAIHRAQANDPSYAGAVADRSSAALDRSIARSALLPSVAYHNQYLYTQPNGVRGPLAASLPPQRFLANNAVHEYTSLGQVNETLGLTPFAEYARAGAASARAAAQMEIARRGLVVTVVDLYYSLFSADQKLLVAGRAANEAQSFSELTQRLESGREVAHADAVKASLQLQQRQRDLSEAKLAAEKSRLDLGVLLFPDPRTDYKLADETAQPSAPPSRTEVDEAAKRNNPDLRTALEALHMADADVTIARSAYFPDVALNYSYGIDASQFAVKGPDGVRNLGYSASVTLDIPVWDWFATHDRVKQSELRRKVARLELTTAQKRLIAQLDETYNEAKTAGDQLTSLDQSVTTAAESLRLTHLRYSAGEGTVLEVVDAQNALTGAETSRADGIVRYRLALANLQTLTGILP